VTQENDVASAYGAMGLSVQTSGVSAEQSLTTPTRKPAARIALSAGSAQVCE
jgi:hypothetical protein